MYLKFKLSPRDRFFLQLLLASALLQTKEAHCDDGFQFFRQPEIDFWTKPGTTENKLKPQSSSAPLRPQKTAPGAFTWNKYLDPKNDEFFREGDYLPPAPFVEIARNPSDENVENWFKYLQAKNEVLQRVQTKLAAYAEKHQNPNELPPNLPPQMVSQIATEPTVKPTPFIPIALLPDAKRFRLRLYFDSKCPHCEHMMGTLQGLSKQGYWIELKQIDSDLQARRNIPFPVSSATQAELKQYQIQTVPVLLIGDLKTHTFLSLKGYQSEDSVLQTLNHLLSKKEGVSL